MSSLLLRVVGFCCVLLFATNVYGQTFFADLLKRYDAAKKPTIVEMRHEALWIGKCVNKSQPNIRIGGMVNSYVFGDNDPMTGSDTLYMAVHHAPNGEPEDYYFQMTRAQAEYSHRDIRSQLRTYSPVKDFDDPLFPNANELIFSQRVNVNNRVQGVDFTLRKDANQNGVPFYILAGRCPFEHCNNNQARYRDILAICYVWENKLPEDQNLDISPDSDWVPDFVSFEMFEQ